MNYFDMAYFVIEFAKKHGHEKTCCVIEEFVLGGDAPRMYNVHPSKYEALAEELCRRY